MHISIHISADEFLNYYCGGARHVVTRSLEGLTVQFPAKALQPYVTRQGVHGEFVIRFDENCRLIKLEALRGGRV